VEGLLLGRRVACPSSAWRHDNEKMIDLVGFDNHLPGRALALRLDDARRCSSVKAS
jgi:hypothetical protein